MQKRRKRFSIVIFFFAVISKLAFIELISKRMEIEQKARKRGEMWSSFILIVEWNENALRSFAHHPKDA